MASNPDLAKLLPEALEKALAIQDEGYLIQALSRSCVTVIRKLGITALLVDQVRPHGCTIAEY